MIIPMLPGVGDVVAQKLPGVVKAIQDIIDPNREFNQAMRMVFIQKPELMQKLVDVEAANPGTLRAFGFNERGTDLLSGMQESVEGLRARQTRPEVEEALRNPSTRRTAAAQQVTGMTPGQQASDQLGEWFSQGGLELLQSDPEAALEAIRARFNVQDPLERRANAATEEALAAVEVPITINGAETKLTEMGLPQWEQAIRSGALSNIQLSGALEDP